MKLMQGLLAKTRRTEGYTLDQTILIVAIIAILITLIILTVGWNLLNRASGTKLASQLRQIEDAIGSFYSDTKLWVDTSYSGAVGSTITAAALTGDVATGPGRTYNAAVVNPKNYLSGFRINGGYPVHAFSANGAVSISRLTNPYGLTGTYLVVQFSGVPYDQTTEAKKAIDGVSDPQLADFTTGRLTASQASCLVVAPSAPTSTTGNKYVCYAANMVQ